jgi:opine dehydrogenase
MTEAIKRIAILGAGPGGIATAAVLSKRGYDVHLFASRHPEKISSIMAAGGVTIEGDLGEDFVPISKITSEISEALSDRQLILCMTPANGQREMAELSAPYLAPGSIFLLAPGSAGSLEVYSIFRDHGINTLNEILLGEFLTLPQSARIVGPSEIRIKLPWKPRLAAFPAKDNDRLYQAIQGILQFRPSPNVLDTGIHTVNFLIHPGPMLLNYAAVERSKGELSLMNEGMTEGVLRCIDALDNEKMAISSALNLSPASIDELYIELGSSPSVYREKGEPFGIRDRIWDRYIYEDVPFGTVMFSSLGNLLGVPTPISDSVNTLLGTLEGVDFYSVGRTAQTLGIDGMKAEDISRLLEEGTA